MSGDLEKCGLLLVGHGTREESGRRQFLELVAWLGERFTRLSRHPHPGPLPEGEGEKCVEFEPLVVEGAFLELAEPGIEVGVGRLLERGVSQIVTAPVILFAAGHVKRDIPAAVAAALAARGRSEIGQVQVGHLGCHRALVELSRLRMAGAETDGTAREGDERSSRGDAEARGMKKDSVADREQADRKQCLLLVARGSSDEEAAAETREFAALRQAERPEMTVEVAFLAKARPRLDEQLAKLAAADYQRLDYKRVIVQPHFLFAGELVDRIRGQIAGIAAGQPEREWIVAEPLADSSGKPGLASKLLAKVIRDRCQEAGIRVVASPDDD